MNTEPKVPIADCLWLEFAIAIEILPQFTTKYSHRKKRITPAGEGEGGMRTQSNNCDFFRENLARKQQNRYFCIVFKEDIAI